MNIIITLIILILTYHIIKYFWSRRWLYYHSSRMHGPRSWPIIGNALHLAGGPDGKSLNPNLMNTHPINSMHQDYWKSSWIWWKNTISHHCDYGSDPNCSSFYHSPRTSPLFSINRCTKTNRINLRNQSLAMACSQHRVRRLIKNGG